MSSGKHGGNARGPDPVFRWLGTAGFKITFGDRVILIDPYLSRNPRARPVQELRPEDMRDADMIFLSHGHFDHIADVPAIAAVSGAGVYCSEVAAKTLLKMGVPPIRINEVGGGSSLYLDGLKASFAACRHIVFDLRLILETLPRLVGEIRELLPHVRGMPAGPCLITTIDFDGLTVTHIGSLGLTPGMLHEVMVPPTDILLIPLQGHTDICRRGAELTAALRPRSVVPQHFDDFFPPVSQMIDIEPFRMTLARILPDCVCFVPELNRPFRASEMLGETR